MTPKRRALILIPVVEFLGMSVWFSASAVVPALTGAWKLGPSDTGRNRGLRPRDIPDPAGL